MSIKNKCLTPKASAKGAGYQIKKTNQLSNNASNIETIKWLKKKIRRFGTKYSLKFDFNHNHT
jgi:hypothetical protein